MKTYFTIHAVALNRKGEILVLQRANDRTKPGIWNCVTGFVNERESAEDAALRELKEETNLKGVIVKTSEPYWSIKDDIRWVISPSLIKVDDTSDLIIDKKESKSFKWLKPNSAFIIKLSSLRKSLKMLEMI